MPGKKPSKPSKTSFASRLKTALRKAGLRQVDLARRLKITTGMVSQWTTGRLDPQRVDDILRIAKAIGCDPSELDPRLASRPGR